MVRRWNGRFVYSVTMMKRYVRPGVTRYETERSTRIKKVREMREWRECCERKESQGFKSKGYERREIMLRAKRIPRI
jgi:hypothetical protein